MKKLGSILKYLEKLEQEEKNEISVTATLAHETDETMKQTIASQAKKLFPGKNVSLEYALDPALIGGVRLRTDETLYDASVAANLRALKKTLVN